MKEIVIFGSGGFAREVHQIIEDINETAGPKGSYQFLGFLDSDPQKHGKEVHGYKVLGSVGWLGEHEQVAIVVAIGNGAARRKVVEEIYGQITHPHFETLIHPRAWIGNRNAIGKGTLVCAGTLITTDIQIGSHVVLNLDCTVGHDTVIEDFCSVSPSVNISGAVHLEEGCTIGTGAKLIENLAIGSWSIIGAGSVVIRNIPKNTTSVGSPAKVVKEREDGWQLVH